MPRWCSLYFITMTRRSLEIGLWRIAWVWFLSAAIIAAGCGTHIPSILPSVTPPAEDEEVRISREFRREAKKHFKFVTHPEVEQYIDRIGRRILSAMGPQPFDYRFFVVNDSQLNAFAVPGGSIYFYTGLIEKAKSTSEIAGVMGHEIVHVKGRHMARSSGPDGVSLLGLVGMLLLAKSGAGAQAAGAVSQAIAATRQIAYSRQLEMEADTLGARYIASAGFDPNGSLEFLKTLDEDRTLNPIDVPAYMLTHPVTKERVANVELVIRNLGQFPHSTNGPDPLRKVQAIIKFEHSQANEVISEYQKNVARNPQDAEALHLLAFAQHLGGQLIEAQKNYEKAKAINPDNASLQRDCGKLYTELGDMPRARAAFERAISLEPNAALTYLYLGELFEKQGDLRSAAGAYINARNLSPQWEKPPARLGTVYGKLNRLGDAYYYLAKSHLLEDEDEQAIAYLEKSLKALGSDSPRAELVKQELNALKARKR